MDPIQQAAQRIKQLEETVAILSRTVETLTQLLKDKEGIPAEKPWQFPQVNPQYPGMQPYPYTYSGYVDNSTVKGTITVS